MDSFMNEFEEFACNRIASTYEGMAEDSEYAATRDKLNKVSKELERKVGFKFSSEVEDAYLDILGIEVEIAYKQGFKDGMALAKEFGMR